MSFIQPMFAAPMSVTRTTKKPVNVFDGNWIAEEKYDGHRLVVEVRAGKIWAWSRDGLLRHLPAHLEEMRDILPNGIYDGELIVPGGKCHDVTELTQLKDLVYVVFDILKEGLDVEDCMNEPYVKRRSRLERLKLNGILSSDSGVVRCPNIKRFKTQEDLTRITREVWDAGGEGLILKNITSIYVPGKRPKTAWVKIKKCESAVLTIIGFEPSRGKIINRGPHATVILQDEQGNVTTVKTKNDVELVKFDREAPKPTEEFQLGSGPRHPSIGRKLRIEFQERTADGSYREPRWDRWEDE